MKTTDLDEIDKWDAKIAEENEIIDFKDFQNIYFNGNVYEAIKICRCNQMRYQELGFIQKISTNLEERILWKYDLRERSIY